VAFIKTQDDNREAVFQAKIGDIKVPDEPVLELTVTMASPAGDEKASEEIQKFLSAIRAGFAITALNSGEGQREGRNPDEFEIDEGILFEVELVRRGPGKGPVRATVVVQNTVEANPRSGYIRSALADVVLWVAAWLLRLLRQPYVIRKIKTLKDSVLAGKYHQYAAIPSQAMPAIVTSTGGCAHVSKQRQPPEKGQKICKNGSWSKTVYMVRVTGITNCCYTLQGDFVLYSSG
jgi:hypothetical protein